MIQSGSLIVSHFICSYGFYLVVAVIQIGSLIASHFSCSYAFCMGVAVIQNGSPIVSHLICSYGFCLVVAVIQIGSLSVSRIICSCIPIVSLSRCTALSGWVWADSACICWCRSVSVSRRYPKANKVAFFFASWVSLGSGGGTPKRCGAPGSCMHQWMESMSTNSAGKGSSWQHWCCGSKPTEPTHLKVISGVLAKLPRFDSDTTKTVECWVVSAWMIQKMHTHTHTHTLE